MDESDIERLYRRFFPLVRAKCARMLLEIQEAEDVAQETFTRFWLSRPRRGELAWLYRTSTRLAIDQMRRRRRNQPFEAAPEPAGGGDPEARLAAARLLDRVAGVVPERELEVAILARVDGLGQAEAAEVLGTSERTVRRLLTLFDERLARLEKP